MAPHSSVHARSQRARIAALARHSRGTGPDTTAAACHAQAARWADQVDPHRQLEPAERARRVDRARRAHMLALAERSARARRRRAER